MTNQRKNRRLLVATLPYVVIFALSASLHAQIVDVRVDGDNGLAEPNPPEPGDTWQNAYMFPQDALVRAQFLLDNNLADTVRLWVAATDDNNPYRPDQCTTCGPGGVPGSSEDPDATFNLINNVEIYGGFSGNETALTQRNPNQHETVLSGAITDLVPGCGPGAGRHNLPILANFPLRFQILVVGCASCRGPYLRGNASAGV